VVDLIWEMRVSLQGSTLCLCLPLQIRVNGIEVDASELRSMCGYVMQVRVHARLMAMPCRFVNQGSHSLHTNNGGT